MASIGEARGIFSEMEEKVEVFIGGGITLEGGLEDGKKSNGCRFAEKAVQSVPPLQGVLRNSLNRLYKFFKKQILG